MQIAIPNLKYFLQTIFFIKNHLEIIINYGIVFLKGEIMFYLGITCLIAFLILIIFNKYFGISALMTIGIGSAIGSNFYNISVFNFKVFGFTTSIDSGVYLVFVFCIVLALIFHGKKQAYNLLVTVICALLFTAILEFLASSATFGITTQVITTLLSFIIISLVTALSGFICISMFEALKNKIPQFLNALIFLVSFLTAKNLVYFTFIISTNKNLTLANALIGTLIGNLLSLLLAIISYFVITKYTYNKSTNLLQPHTTT